MDGMDEAFRAAGIVPVRDRIMAAARAAVAVHPANFDQSADLFWDLLMRDPEAMRTAIRPRQGMIAREYLSAAARSAADGRGQVATARNDQTDGAPSVPPNPPVPGDGGQYGGAGDGHEYLAPTARNTRTPATPGSGGHADPAGKGQLRSAPAPRGPSDEERRVMREAGRGAEVEGARRSLLRSIVLNGRPIGELTAKEVDAWVESARSRARGLNITARTAEILAQNVPPDEKIGDWRTDADAEVAQAAALREIDNA